MNCGNNAKRIQPMILPRRKPIPRKAVVTHQLGTSDARLGGHDGLMGWLFNATSIPKPEEEGEESEKEEIAPTAPRKLPTTS